jgi:hypothetical protein
MTQTFAIIYIPHLGLLFDVQDHPNYSESRLSN